MAKGIADTNVALGFAGVVLVLAVVAALSMDLIVPAISGEEAEEQVAVAEPEEAPKPQAKPTPVATTWADEGSASDDWGAPAAGMVSGGGGPAEDGGNGLEDTATDFAPQVASNNAAAARSSNARPARRGNGRVTSGAAAGAPALRPTGAPERSEAPSGGRN